MKRYSCGFPVRHFHRYKWMVSLCLWLHGEKNSAREYWIMTEIFVYLHGGDSCNESKPCRHCEFIEKVF